MYLTAMTEHKNNLFDFVTSRVNSCTESPRASLHMSREPFDHEF